MLQSSLFSDKSWQLFSGHGGFLVLCPASRKSSDRKEKRGRLNPHLRALEERSRNSSRGRYVNFSNIVHAIRLRLGVAESNKLQYRLSAAGYYHRSALDIYVGIRVLLPVVAVALVSFFSVSFVAIARCGGCRLSDSRLCAGQAYNKAAESSDRACRTRLTCWSFAWMQALAWTRPYSAPPMCLCRLPRSLQRTPLSWSLAADGANPRSGLETTGNPHKVDGHRANCEYAQPGGCLRNSHLGCLARSRGLPAHAAKATRRGTRRA
jgi:hypothetical protein